MISRLLLGLAYGYVYVTCIIHASEIMTQKIRGMIVATFNFIIVTGILLTSSQLISTDPEVHKNGFVPMQILGVTMVAFPILGLIFLPFFTRESPVHLMIQKKFNEALQLMMRVRNESTETWSVRNEFQELKTMVEEDQQMSRHIFHDGNGRPWLLMTLLKIGSVLAFNLGVNMIRLENIKIFSDQESQIVYGGLLLISMRLTVGMITLFTIDSIGRRRNFLIAHGGTAVAFIFLGIFIYWFDNNYVIMVIQFLIEIFGGIGIGSVADVYLSEAFSTFKKPFSIFATCLVEFGMHIVIIALCLGREITEFYSTTFLMVSGGLLLYITYYLSRKLPETSKMSIRQSRNEFLKSGDIVFSGGNQMPQNQINFY